VPEPQPDEEGPSLKGLPSPLACSEREARSRNFEFRGGGGWPEAGCGGKHAGTAILSPGPFSPQRREAQGEAQGRGVEGSSGTGSGGKLRGGKLRDGEREAQGRGVVRWGAIHGGEAQGRGVVRGGAIHGEAERQRSTRRK
jgi:hypothetical protein